MRHVRLICGALAALALLVFSLPLSAHGGEDHAPPRPGQAGLTAQQPGQGAESALFQVVIAPDGDRAARLYLADARTNAPIAEARLDIEAGPWKGAAKPLGRAGVYGLDWPMPSQPVDVLVVVSALAGDDLLLIPAVHRVVSDPVQTPRAPIPWQAWGGGMGIGLLIGIFLSRSKKAALVILPALLLGGPVLAHGGEDHGASDAVPMAAPGDVLVMDKETQFLLEIRTQPAYPRLEPDRQRLVGRVIADPDHHARLHASQPARILGGDQGVALPLPGQRVRKGQVVAVLEPTLTAMEKGDRRAQLARIDAELAVQEREVPRLRALASAIPFRTLETAEIRLDQLRRERGQIAAAVLGREILTAPMDGVVTDTHLVPGEVVGSERTLVEIIDPAHVQIEVPIHQPGLTRSITGATASTRLLPGQDFGLSLVAVSPKLDPVDQGVHVLFRVTDGGSVFLKVGMGVDVFVESGESRPRTLLPRQALTEWQGRPAVLIRTGPETFSVKPVTVLAELGQSMEIQGLEPGERVVTQGVRHIRAGR